MITRRDFLRSAGGITALTIMPVSERLFAAPAPVDGPRLPLFTVVPYIQPGSASALRDGSESIVIAWQTLAAAANFVVEFGPTAGYGRIIRCEHRPRLSGKGGDSEPRLNWTASIDDLRLGQQYHYRVRGNSQTLAEGYFTTRQPRGQRIRFVSFGDNSYGDISDRAIAYHTYQQHPDFVMNCGDNVYESGTDDEYQRYFFPVYNADVAGARIGAPLMRSVPFYTVIANHDVQGKDENGHEVADFARNPDALAYYTAMHLPLNGPASPTYPTPRTGPADRLAAIDLRDYMYYRTRWGVSGSSDYRVNSSTSLAVRGLYSTFRNWGQKWVYALNDGDVPSASIDWRRPDYAIGNIVGSGRHLINQNWATWDLPFARSRMLQSGGNGGSKFKWNGTDTNCAFDPGATVDPLVPQFAASCFTPGATNVEDIANYRLSNWSPASVGDPRSGTCRPPPRSVGRIGPESASARSSSAARFETPTNSTIPTRPPTRWRKA